MAFSKVCDRAEIPADGVLRIESGPEPVAIFDVDGELFATQDQCSHGDWPLSEGIVEDGIVECSLHWAKFCVRTGKVKARPACDALRVYDVQVDGDDVLIDFQSGRVRA